jgi:hypothetical protein
MAIYLDSPFGNGFQTKEIDSEQLYVQLAELYRKVMQIDGANSGGIVFQRTARVYDVTRHQDNVIPTVYVIKPDQARYWTRSMALRDADEVAADIMSWYGTKPATPNSSGAMV